MHWASLLIGAGVGAACAAIALLATSCGTAVRPRTIDASAGWTGPVFPEVSGDNLNGRAFVMPRDFDGQYNVVMVAFFQRQQYDVNTWLADAERLSRDHANVEYYELPVISGAWAPAKAWVDGGMRSGIPDIAQRERTITVFTDTEKFRSLAGIEGSDRIWTGVMDKEGRVYWSTRGPATPETLAELRSVVAGLARGQ
jgi:hypothetical protein